MKQFKELKKNLLERLGNDKLLHNYAFNCTSIEEILNIVKENFNYFSSKKIIDTDFINEYKDIFNSEKIYANVDVTDGFLLVDGSSKVSSLGYSRVTGYDNSTVNAYGNSTVIAWGNSRVTGYYNSTVNAYDNSIVSALGYSRVIGYDNSILIAYGNSRVSAFGNSKLIDLRK